MKEFWTLKLPANNLAPDAQISEEANMTPLKVNNSIELILIIIKMMKLQRIQKNKYKNDPQIQRGCKSNT
jgi:hypothetical protein